MENGVWEEVYPDSDLWNWEEHPELEGKFAGMEEKLKRDGTSFMVYKIEREGTYEDGNIVTITGGTILDPRLKKCELGTKVKIIYLGKVLSGNGYEYKNFKVEKWKPNEGKVGKDDKGFQESSQKKEDISEILSEERDSIDVRDIPF